MSSMRSSKATCTSTQYMYEPCIVYAMCESQHIYFNRFSTPRDPARQQQIFVFVFRYACTRAKEEDGGRRTEEGTERHAHMGEAKDRLEVFVGGVCASVFPFMYYAVALYLAATVAQFARLVVFGMGNASFVVGLATPALLSVMMANWHRKRDAAPFPALFMTYVFKCLNSYFDYHEFLELSDDLLYEEMNRKPVIMAIAPHGVLSFGGLCGLCYDFADYDEMKKNADGKDSVDVKRRIQYLNMSEHDKQSFRLRELLPKLRRNPRC